MVNAMHYFSEGIHLKKATETKLIKGLTWLIVLFEIIEGILSTLGMVKPLNWLLLGSTATALILILVVQGVYRWTNRSNQI